MKRSLLCAGLALFAASCGDNSGKTDHPDAAKAEFTIEKNLVDTMTLRLRNFNKQIVSNGKLRAVTKSVLHFQTSGEIAQINTANGQSVDKGAVIARLNPDAAELKLQQARLQMDKAGIDLSDALISFGYSDTTDIPEERRRVANIKSGYTTAENNLRLAEIDLENTVLKAPFSGKIANLKAKVYEQAPTEGFCTLIDDRTFNVDFNLLESELAFVRQGQTVRIAAFNAPDRYYTGTIRSINPLVDDKGQINVEAEVQNRDGKLLEGMNVRVLVENTIPARMVVPKSAVVIRDNQEVLFRLGPEGKAMWTYVNIEMSNSDSHVVAPNEDKGAELNLNDIVITSGNLNLADGSEVEVRKRPE